MLIIRKWLLRYFKHLTQENSNSADNYFHRDSFLGE